MDGGLFIASGIICRRRMAVAAAKTLVLQLVEEGSEAEWVCLVSRK